MSSFTDHYEMTLPAADDPVDINVLNGNFRTVDGLIYDLATASDRVTGASSTVADQFVWKTRSWANGTIEMFGTRVFNLAKAGFSDIEVTLPSGYALADPYFITAIPTYRGPWTSVVNNKNSFATKFKAAMPKIYCMPYQLEATKFHLYVWNLTGEQTAFGVNVQIVGNSR